MSQRIPDSYKLSLPIGTDIVLSDIPAWLKSRIAENYCFIRSGMRGKIIGYTNALEDGTTKRKIAVEFNEPVWRPKFNGKRSSYDTGCHGKGKIGRCAYFLPGHIQVLSGSTSDCIFPLENKYTTMLLRRRVK